jgi:hypothetical protein
VNPAPVAPTITTQPVNQTVTAGQTATFAVVASGTAPLGYQWQKNGANIAGATAASYTTPATTSSDNGAQFTVVVTNTAGTVTSAAATLTVNPAPVAPTITTQPVNQTVTAGQTATFAVVAAGTAPLGYQWQKNGANIAGATTATYTTPATTTSDSGVSFAVVVTNTAGTVTSAAATLTVNPAPAPVIQPSPTSFNFLNDPVGTNMSQVLIIKNTGTATLTITQITATGPAFSVSGFTLPLNVNAGQQTTVTVDFLPTAVGTVSGNISIVSNAPTSPTIVGLSGTAIAATLTLGISPKSLSFGNVTTGTSSAGQNITITNTGNSSVTIAQINLNGAGYSMTGSSAPVTLTPSQNLTLTIQFSPTVAGTVNGSISIVSDATGSPASVPLSGTGVLLNVSPTTLSFGNQIVNTTSGAQAVTLSNGGSTAITINNVQAAAPFAVSGFSGVTTLSAGQSLPLTVTFTPTIQTVYNGTLTISYNSTSSATVTLSGTGIVQTSGAPYTSRTDRNAAPETIPTLCSPAPCAMTSSDLNSNLTYLRVTDASTDSGVQFGTGAGGWEREWNSDGSAFWVNGLDGAVRFFTFDASTQSAAAIACSYSDSFGTCHNGKLSSYGIGVPSVEFSTVSPYVVYGISSSGANLRKMDFSATVANGAVAPTITVVGQPSTTSGIPTTSCSGCQLMSNTGDTRFDVGLGGSQNSWTTIWVYDTTQHGRWFGMNTMTVGGDWGPTGNANLFDEHGNLLCSGSGCTNVGGINYTCSSGHDMVMDQTGRWAFLQTECSQTLGVPGVWYFWDVATSNVYFIGGSSFAPYGHNAPGYSDIWLNTAASGGAWLQKRLITSAATFSGLFPGVGVQPSDSHLSWNNAAPGQLPPVIESFFQGSAPTAFWQDEIVGMSTDGSQIAYRFAHMFTRAASFYAQGIANVSRDGKWALFCSDWGGGARHDIFLVPLK